MFNVGPLKMTDRSKVRIHSYTDSILAEIRKRGSSIGSEQFLLQILPNSIRLIIEGRPSARVPKLRQYFLKYTDQHYRPSGEDLCEELTQVNDYLQKHVLHNNKCKTFIEDPAILYLYHAEVPQILLELLHQTVHKPEYFVGSPKFRSIAYLVVEILTCFLHPSSATFLHFPNKFFDDSRSRIETLTGILHGKLNWFDRLAVLHFFGVASFTPPGVYWLMTHLDTYREVCSSMVNSAFFIGVQIRRGKVDPKDETISTQFRTFRDSPDLKESALILGHLITGQCIHVFLNVLEYSRTHYEKFLKVARIVRAVDVLGNFHSVIKQVMAWSDPTHFLNPFLNGVAICMEMEKGYEELLLIDIDACVQDGIPLGVESLKYWNHDRRAFPCRLAWFLVHAFCLDDNVGSGWCLHIICWFLTMATDKVTFKIVENCGNELMDLAHLIYIKGPIYTNVQALVLEAILKYGGVGFLERDGERFEGTMKRPPDMKDFVLEAAVFCKKASCEEEMDVFVKHRRVHDADRLKDEGNQHFKAGKYKEAIKSYSDAIAVCPLSCRARQAVYYSNRAECYLRNQEYMRAIHDCNRSLCLDKSAKVKVQWRRSRAYQKLHLDYPAWLDMRCIKDDWTLSKAESGVDFDQLYKSLEEKVGVFKESKEGLEYSLVRQTWYTWLLVDD